MEWCICVGLDGRVVGCGSSIGMVSHLGAGDVDIVDPRVLFEIVNSGIPQFLCERLSHHWRFAVVIPQTAERLFLSDVWKCQ